MQSQSGRLDAPTTAQFARQFHAGPKPAHSNATLCPKLGCTNWQPHTPLGPLTQTTYSLFLSLATRRHKIQLQAPTSGQPVTLCPEAWPLWRVLFETVCGVLLEEKVARECCWRGAEQRVVRRRRAEEKRSSFFPFHFSAAAILPKCLHQDHEIQSELTFHCSPSPSFLFAFGHHPEDCLQCLGAPPRSRCRD